VLGEATVLIGATVLVEVSVIVGVTVLERMYIGAMVLEATVIIGATALKVTVPVAIYGIIRATVLEATVLMDATVLVGATVLGGEELFKLYAYIYVHRGCVYFSYCHCVRQPFPPSLRKEVFFMPYVADRLALSVIYSFSSFTCGRRFFTYSCFNKDIILVQIKVNAVVIS
jgi:hypothetical protein